MGRCLRVRRLIFILFALCCYSTATLSNDVAKSTPVISAIEKLISELEKEGWSPELVLPAVGKLHVSLKENDLDSEQAQAVSGAIDTLRNRLGEYPKLIEDDSIRDALEELHQVLANELTQKGYLPALANIKDTLTGIATIDETSADTIAIGKRRIAAIQASSIAQQHLRDIQVSVNKLLKQTDKERLAALADGIDGVASDVSGDQSRLAKLWADGASRDRLTSIVEKAGSLQPDGDVIASADTLLQNLKVRLGGSDRKFSSDLARLDAVLTAQHTSIRNIQHNLRWLHRPLSVQDDKVSSKRDALQYFADALVRTKDDMESLEADMTPEIRALLRRRLNVAWADRSSTEQAITQEIWERQVKALNGLGGAIAPLRDPLQIHVVRAWYGNLYAKWSSGEKCNAVLTVRGRCQRKHECTAQDAAGALAADDLCGYNAAPVAQGNARGLVVQYACLRGGDDTWDKLSSQPLTHPTTKKRFRLKTSMSQVVLRSGAMKLRCPYPE